MNPTRENNNQKGFVLLEILLAIAVIALIVGGFYFKGSQNSESVVETGLDAEKRAGEVVNQINKQSQNQQKVLEELRRAATSTPNSKPVQE